jgi:hypothetical protein
MVTNLRSTILSAVASMLLIGSVPAARAADVCSGTLSGSPLRPIAKPIVISLTHRLDSTANPELAKQFLAGIQGAGVSVVPAGQGTTTLDLSFLLHGKRKGTYHDLTWMRGSPASAELNSSLQGSHIDVTIYARDAASRGLVWTGVISCTIQSSDGGALAEGLGAAVGRSLGQSIPKRAL